MTIDYLLMFIRLYNRSVASISAMAFHSSVQRPSRRSVYVQERKTARKQKVIVWKGMTIKDLVKSMNKTGDDVMDAIRRVRIVDQTLSYSTEIHDMSLLSKVANLCGYCIQEKVSEKVEEIIDKDVYNRNIYLNTERLRCRPPVVTIMGHVDHGKTTLIDSLRSSRIVDSEFGGITQHIGAFKVKLSDISDKANANYTNDIVTFLDTPGHAAFSSMRSRGAHCTDIVILVVSIDDGLMPQTLESIRYAKEAKVPMIVVMNKIDRFISKRDDINAPTNTRRFDQIRQSLSKHGVVVEELGGDVQCIPISALKKWNLDLLQESILALAEIIDIKCDYEGPCEGVVLEAKNVDNFGKIATVLIQQGTLTLGSILVAGMTFAKVRTLRSDAGQLISIALPGDPVEVTGWRDNLPFAGDGVIEVATESRAKEVFNYRKSLTDKEKMERDYEEYMNKMAAYKVSYKEYINEGLKKGFRSWTDRPDLSKFLPTVNIVDGVEIPQVNVVIKTDVQGSMEAIEDVLAIAIESCASQSIIKIARMGVGQLTESDIEVAICTNAIVYLFNLPGSLSVTRSMALDVRHFNVIYHLFDNLRDTLAARLPQLTDCEVVGEAEIMVMFDIRDKKVTLPVIGCKCTSGILFRNKDQYYCRVMRPTVVDGAVTLTLVKDGLVCKSLKHLKNDVESIRKGVECGMVLLDEKGESFVGNTGDVIQCCKTVLVSQQLNWNLGFQ